MSYLRDIFATLKGTGGELIGSIQNALKVSLHDGNGNPLFSVDGALDIHDADVHGVAFNEFFHEHTGVNTTLAVASSKGDTSITVVSSASIIVGSIVQIKNGVIETTFPIVTAVTGNILTLDRPLDYAFSIGDAVEVISTEMNINATLSSPRSFKIIPDGNQKWHVISITVSIVHGSAGDDSLFGDGTALTNGIVFRGYNATADQYRTLTNWKTNGDFGLDFNGVTYSDKAGGGKFGTFASTSIKTRAGAIPEIDGSLGDYIEVLIQDAILTTLGAGSSLRLKAQGHVII